MEATEYLRQLHKLDKLITNKLIEKEQWRTIAFGTTARSDGERVQASGSQQKMADAVVRCIEIEEEINEYIDKLIDKRQEIISVIDKLPPVEYDFIHKVYVQFYTLRQAGELMGKEYGWAKKTHRSALREVQKILDERAGNEKRTEME
jgi:DNA-directed RNA polymerase specialized sigma24 family protein